MEFTKLIMESKVVGFRNQMHFIDERKKLKYWTKSAGLFSSDFYLNNASGIEETLIKKINFFSYNYDVIQGANVVAQIRKQQNFTKLNIEAHCDDCTYEIREEKIIGFDVSILKSGEEIAKISKKRNGFKYIYGLAISNEENLEVLLSLLAIFVKIKKAQGASG